MHEGVAVRELANDEAARIIEAKREGWLGEVEGLQVSYSGVKDKLAQIDATLQRRKATATELGMPSFGSISGRASAHETKFRKAYVRCPLLRSDPAQRARRDEIRDNLEARIAEAKGEGWLGEVEGLRISLAGVDDRLAQIDRRHAAAVVDLQPLTMCLER